MEMKPVNQTNELSGCTPEGTKTVGTICFGMDADAASRAIQRIRTGQKRAMIYPKYGYRTSMHPQPNVGNLNLVVDWHGNPECIIETTAVHMLPAGCVTDAHIALAADYADANEWRESEIKTEIEELGGCFDADTPVIIEEFRCV